MGTTGSFGEEATMNRRELKPKVVQEKDEFSSFLPSGCAVLDCVMGGGYAEGRIINIVGDKSTGKTLLAIEAAANYAKKWPSSAIIYNEKAATGGRDTIHKAATGGRGHTLLNYRKALSRPPVAALYQEQAMKNKNIISAVAVLCVLALSSTLLAADLSDSELFGALKSDNEPVRLRAIDALGLRGGRIPGAVPALIEQLDDSSPMVRAHAAHALGRIGRAAKPAAATLAKLIGDEDPRVRRAAARAYGRIRPGPEVSIPLFSKLLKESEPEVRVHVMAAIAEDGKAAVPALTKALDHKDAAYWACLLLADIGPDAAPAVPALVKLLNTDDRPEVRREAMLALAKIGPGAEPAVPALVNALDDHRRFIRGPAVYTLGSIGPKANVAEGKLRRIVNDKNFPPFIRTLSLWALAKINPDDKLLVRRVVPRLVLAMTAKNPRIRAAAVQALIDLKPDPAIVRPVIKKAMENADPEAIDDMLDALASLGTASVPNLIDALGEEEVRAEAATIIARIGPPAKAAVPALIEALGDENPKTRSEVLFALAAIGPDAAAAVPAITAALNDPDMNVRYGACYALGKIGPAAMPAKTHLQKGLSNADEFLSAASAWALSYIHPECAETAKKSVPVLVRALKETDAMTRLHAAESLGRLGSLAKDAVDDLNKLLEDGDQHVRGAAAKAIEAISGK